MSANVPNHPSHVPAELVRDFDFSNIPGAETDVHLAWHRLHDGPDIFWTPRNGGHWLATRADDIDIMQTDHERFSHRHVSIPAHPEIPPLAPLEIDPPAHGPYRAILSPAFGPKPMQSLEPDLRRLAVKLLDGFAARGRCEFVDEFAKRLPIVTFLRLVDLPLDDREHLLALAEDAVRPQTNQHRVDAFVGLQAYMKKWILARRREPKGDLISRIVSAKIDGRPLNDAELDGMMINVIFGGLDTVSSALSFTANCLAGRADLRQQLARDRALIPIAIEEFLRRFGIPNTARLITHDFQYKGLTFKKGDLIMLPKTLHGLDERRFANPLDIDFRRERKAHAAFGAGPHHCPGSFLARLEMKVFLEEWLKRIPDFRIPAGQTVQMTAGPVNGVVRLPLTWN